jgi:plasmid stabilization system protein ParE
MSYRVEFSPLAESELQVSFDWYEEQEPGLGERFLETIDRLLKSISLNPEIFSKKRKNQREAVTIDFPFIIIYESLKKDNLVNILHIFHTSRNPKFKYKLKR